MPKYFPCPICKGEGGWTEPIDYFIGGPYYKCFFCYGEGMVEINGPTHRKMKIDNIYNHICCKLLDPEEDWLMEEDFETVKAMVNKIADFIDSKKISYEAYMVRTGWHMAVDTINNREYWEYVGKDDE